MASRIEFSWLRAVLPDSGCNTFCGFLVTLAYREIGRGSDYHSYRMVDVLWIILGDLINDWQEVVSWLLARSSWLWYKGCFVSGSEGVGGAGRLR